MQSHELMREVLKKTSAKNVSADLGLSLSTIYKWAEEDEGEGSGVANPLDRIEALFRSTKDRRLEGQAAEVLAWVHVLAKRGEPTTPESWQSWSCPASFHGEATCR